MVYTSICFACLFCWFVCFPLVSFLLAFLEHVLNVHNGYEVSFIPKNAFVLLSQINMKMAVKFCVKDGVSVYGAYTPVYFMRKVQALGCPDLYHVASEILTGVVTGGFA